MTDNPYVSPGREERKASVGSDGGRGLREGPRAFVGCLSVVAISVCGLVVGACTLSGFIAGPLGILGGPVFALFGWFYLPVIVLCVAVLHFVYNPSWSTLPRAAFVLAASLLGSGLMLLIGARGPEVQWLWGYGVGGFLAAGTCSLLTIFSSRLHN